LNYFYTNYKGKEKKLTPTITVLIAGAAQSEHDVDETDKKKWDITYSGKKVDFVLIFGGKCEGKNFYLGFC